MQVSRNIICQEACQKAFKKYERKREKVTGGEANKEAIEWIKIQKMEEGRIKKRMTQNDGWILKRYVLDCGFLWIAHMMYLKVLCRALLSSLVKLMMALAWSASSPTPPHASRLRVALWFMAHIRASTWETERERQRERERERETHIQREKER